MYELEWFYWILADFIENKTMKVGFEMDNNGCSVKQEVV